MRSRKTAISFPSARTDGLLVERIGDEAVVYDLGSKQAHCLKPLASFVFTRADGRTSAEDIGRLAEGVLGQAVSGADVQEAIAELERCALLDTPSALREGLSRRDVVRKAGYAGAAAIGGTMITSILAPTSAMAKSGVPTGCTGCGKNSDCASNHCCQSNPGKQCNQSCCVGSNNSCHITGCVCVGGSNPGTDCSACGQNCTICKGGGTCICSCTVCLSDTDCHQCPCASCPPGSVTCCSNNC